MVDVRHFIHYRLYLASLFYIFEILGKNLLGCIKVRILYTVEVFTLSGFFCTLIRHDVNWKIYI